MKRAGWRGPTNNLNSATGEAGSTRTRRRKSFTFDKAGNVVGGGSEPRPADEETKEEQVQPAKKRRERGRRRRRRNASDLRTAGPGLSLHLR